MNVLNRPSMYAMQPARSRLGDTTHRGSQAAARASGFNLVELMAALAIVAVLSAIAVPGFSKISTNKTIRTEAHGILTGLELARTEAIFRNASVSFTLKDGIGWAVATVSPVSVIRTHMPTDSSKGLRVTTSNNQTSVVFNSLGLVSRYDASMALTRITVTPPPGTGGHSLQIDVSPGGQVRMCNPAITAAKDLAKC